jgi:hypothetical protein
VGRAILSPPRFLERAGANGGALALAKAIMPQEESLADGFFSKKTDGPLLKLALALLHSQRASRRQRSAELAAGQ